MGVEAPGAGTLVEISVGEGQTATVGQTVCVVEAPTPQTSR